MMPKFPMEERSIYIMLEEGHLEPLFLPDKWSKMYAYRWVLLYCVIEKY